MPDLTPAQRALRARIAAHESWAKTPDRRARTAAAAEASHGLSRFEREVDPDGTLDPAERRLRAENARKAHFARLALKRSKKGGRGDG